MPKILIVDDNPQNLYMLEVLLTTHGFSVEKAANGLEALGKAHKDPPDLVISDILMPVMDGYRLCRLLKSDEALKHIPLIFYTATHTEKQDEEFALNLGAERYIVKPTDPENLLSELQKLLIQKDKNSQNGNHTLIEKDEEFYKEYNEALIRKLEDKMLQLEKKNLELSQAYDVTIEGWSRALDLRDNKTEGHSLRVKEMTVKLAKHFDFNVDELVQISRGALLHDIGKMGVPDSILLKPGPLTDDEWVIMRKHTTYAKELLSPIPFLIPAIPIPFCHHEKWDGSGYPRGLKKEQIPLEARIFAMVDVWDALRSDRPYRKAWSVEKTHNHIESLSGTHFDPEVLKVCLKADVFILA